MGFIDELITQTMTDISPEKQEKFLKALHHSLSINPFNYTHESFDVFTLTQKELYNLKILLLRPLAFEFVHEYYPNITKNQFDKRTTYPVYQTFFNREPWLISVKPRIMFLTYAEWITLSQQEHVTIPLPPVLSY